MNKKFMKQADCPHGLSKTDPKGWIAKHVLVVVENYVQFVNVRNVVTALKLASNKLSQVTEDKQIVDPYSYVVDGYVVKFDEPWEQCLLKLAKGLALSGVSEMSKARPDEMDWNEMFTILSKTKAGFNIPHNGFFTSSKLALQRAEWLWNNVRLPQMRNARVSKKIHLYVDGDLSLLGALVAYSAQRYLEDFSAVSSANFDLPRTHIRNAIMQRIDVKPDSKQKHCEVTGDAVQAHHLGVYVNDDGLELMTTRRTAEANGYPRAVVWKERKHIISGLPVLTNCSCCALRRPVRTEQHEGSEAIHADNRYWDILRSQNLNGPLLQWDNDIIQGATIDFTKLVMSVGFVVIKTDKVGRVEYENARMCPSCLRLARSQPKHYLAWIAALSIQVRNSSYVKAHEAWKLLEESIDATEHLPYGRTEDRNDYVNETSPNGNSVNAALETRISDLKRKSVYCMSEYGVDVMEGFIKDLQLVHEYFRKHGDIDEGQHEELFALIKFDQNLKEVDLHVTVLGAISDGGE